MSRPKPILICTHVVGDTYYEVCEADAVYAVLYQGKPIKMRSHNPDIPHLSYKYGKSMFPEPGHAIRLARKLNAAHDTEEFTVAIMTVGRSFKIY
jgi:hypothetical protein